MVRDGDLVSFKYAVVDEDGETLDGSGDTPVEHICGAHTLVPGLERALLGRAPGDTFSVRVAPAYGFGERATDDAQVTLKLKELPAEMPLELGMIAMLEDAAGEPMPMFLVGLSDDEATFDCNHPLAGVTLDFTVEIIAVRPATADEKRSNLMAVTP